MLEEMIRQIDEPEHAVLSLEVQAAMGPVVQPERSQFELLVRHLLDRFFNNDMVSVEGETMKRLILAAAVIAVPQLIFALFLVSGLSRGASDSSFEAAVLVAGESSLLLCDVFVCGDGGGDGV